MTDYQTDYKIRMLQSEIRVLEAALELIAGARKKGHCIYYAEGVAEASLDRLRGQRAAAGVGNAVAAG